MSAAEAVRAGATYVVVGRPICGADPAAAAARLAGALFNQQRRTKSKEL